MRVSQGESRSRERDRTDLIKSTDLLCTSQAQPDIETTWDISI